MALETAARRPPLAGVTTLVGKVRAILPVGQTLPESVWQARHRALMWLLVAQGAALIVFAYFEGESVLHSIAHGLIIFTFAGLAILAGQKRRLASALVALGLITTSALLVHAWNGVIEAHFHFFVMILVLALYEDWLPFLFAMVYVVLHHGLMGSIDPGTVYNHPDAIANPWKWAAIHAFFVTGAGISSVAAWRLNENARADTQTAYDKARENEERFMGAFEGAPIGMTLAAVDESGVGHVMQVNEAMCEISGYSEQQLLGRALGTLTHPEDREQHRIPLEKLISGDLSSYKTEKRYIRADGEVIWAMVSASVVRDSTGRPGYVITQVQDISDRKRAEDQLIYQARHDSLTGLPNRRRLMGDLEVQLADASAERPLTLLLFDLDGFKAYNDTFGHPAGDALLKRLSEQVVSMMGDRGEAYRMGGDEFCVLAQASDAEAEALGVAVAGALAERGEGFTVTASYGLVAMPREAHTSVEALRIADQRMYARKGLLGRASAGRQTTDVLLQVLSERSPELGVHVDGVTLLCAAIGRRLELPDEEMAPLLRGASLHDVGKSAIPDSILNKPGPLNEQEWAFMRGHPEVGARILEAAPALVGAAKLVRASHERWDGKGYPAGIAGETIPLGARIIAVCDAYDAMISDRPYREARSPEEALAELRSCAGTQFDPVIVEAFCASLADSENGRPATAPVSSLAA